jgi:hypothetical protein
MLNKEVIELIKAASVINNKLIVSYPNTTVKNISGDVQGIIDFSTVSDEFPEMGFWDVGSFLNSISILEDPKITIGGNILTAKDEYSSINYVLSSPEICADATTDPRIITSTLSIDSIVEVDINSSTMQRMKKGSNVFRNLKDFFFVKKGDEFFVRTGNKSSFNSSDNAFTLKLEPNKINGEDFEIAIPIENFLGVPDMDFKMSVHEKNGQFRISLSNPIIKLVLSLKR